MVVEIYINVKILLQLRYIHESGQTHEEMWFVRSLMCLPVSFRALYYTHIRSRSPTDEPARPYATDKRHKFNGHVQTTYYRIIWDIVDALWYQEFQHTIKTTPCWLCWKTEKSNDWRLTKKRPSLGSYNVTSLFEEILLDETISHIKRWSHPLPNLPTPQSVLDLQCITIGFRQTTRG